MLVMSDAMTHRFFKDYQITLPVQRADFLDLLRNCDSLAQNSVIEEFIPGGRILFDGDNFAIATYRGWAITNCNLEILSAIHFEGLSKEDIASKFCSSLVLAREKSIKVIGI